LAPVFDAPLHSTDQSIDRVLNAGLPVVLVFVDGSMPASLDAAMKKLARDEAGSLLVVQTSTKDSPQAAQRFGVQNLPGVVAVKNGQVQSKSDAIEAGELARHALFLLGKGPRPEPAKPTGSHFSSSSTGASQPGSSGVEHSVGRPVTVTDTSFDQEVMRSALPVVVDFWAPWCGPCRMVAPVLDKLASEWAGRVKIAKVNVDENPQAAGRYGVQAIPTMLVVKGGRVIDQWAGAMPEQAMRARLAQLLR
jgi:thioredoxin 1